MNSDNMEQIQEWEVGMVTLCLNKTKQNWAATGCQFVKRCVCGGKNGKLWWFDHCLLFLPTKLTHYFLVRAGVHSARFLLTSIIEIVLLLHPLQFLNRVKICSLIKSGYAL